MLCMCYLAVILISFKSAYSRLQSLNVSAFSEKYTRSKYQTGYNKILRSKKNFFSIQKLNIKLIKL